MCMCALHHHTTAPWQNNLLPLHIRNRTVNLKSGDVFKIVENPSLSYILFEFDVREERLSTISKHTIKNSEFHTMHATISISAPIFSSRRSTQHNLDIKFCYLSMHSMLPL
jgi:hypothetical protein